MAAIEAIATVYLEADVASVEFASLGSYEHLQLRTCIATDSTHTSGVHRDSYYLYFNTSTATTNSDYSTFGMKGETTTVRASKDAGINYIYTEFTAGTTKGIPYFGTCILDILDYGNGAKNTTVMASVGAVGPVPTTLTESGVGLGSGLWDNVAAVTKLLLTPQLGSNFRRGSEFTLYGIQDS